MKYNSEILFNTKFLQLKQTKSPANHDWFYAHRPNAENGVTIAPILHTKDGDFLIFLETRRPPMYAENKAEFCIEFPAGLLGDEIENETVEECIKKELLEETGYELSNIEIISNLVSTSGGLTSETTVYAIADIEKNVISRNPITDGGIIINIHKIPFSHIDNWLKEQEKSGKAIAASVYGLLYFVYKKQIKK